MSEPLNVSEIGISSKFPKNEDFDFGGDFNETQQDYFDYADFEMIFPESQVSKKSAIHDERLDMTKLSLIKIKFEEAVQQFSFSILDPKCFGALGGLAHGPNHKLGSASGDSV